MVNWLSNRKGFSLVDVTAGGMVLALSLYLGLRSHRQTLNGMASLKLRQAITASEKDLQGIGLWMANDFYKRIIFDSTGARRSPSGCSDIPYSSEIFVRDGNLNGSVVTSPSGMTLTLLNLGRMVLSGGHYVIPTDPSITNEKYLAAINRCATTPTVYYNDKPRLTDISAQSELYWCMRIGSLGSGNPQRDREALSSMQAIVEFKFSAIDVQTGKALTCSEIAAKKNFTDPENDTVVGSLYYSVYWSSTNLDGKLMTADFSGSFIGGGL